MSDYKYNFFLITICIPSGTGIADGLLDKHQDDSAVGKYTIWSPLENYESDKADLTLIPNVRVKLPHNKISKHQSDVNIILPDVLPKNFIYQSVVIIFSHLIPHKTCIPSTEKPRHTFILCFSEGKLSPCVRIVVASINLVNKQGAVS